MCSFLAIGSQFPVRAGMLSQPAAHGGFMIVKTGRAKALYFLLCASPRPEGRG